MSTLVASRDF
jgi:hypothetical protein